MARKRIKVEVLISAVVVLIVSGFGGVVVRPALEPDQVIPSRFGDVVWSHDLHAHDDEVGNCTVCHHQEKQGELNPRSCHDCHEPMTNADALLVADLFMEVEEEEYEGEHGPPPRVAFHAKCIGCHRAVNKGPLVCRDCHEQRFSGNHGVVTWNHRAHARLMDMPENEKAPDDNCVYCHHEDADAVTTADYRPCGACHEPARQKIMDWATGIEEHEAEVHGQCHTCHSEFNPEDDLRTCGDCHEGIVIDVPEDEKHDHPPSLEQAIHDRCQACHNKEYSDITSQMPVYCDDCHKSDPSWLEVPGVGPMLWDHKRHGDFGEEIACDTCHHADLPGEPHAACWRCHEEVDERFENPTLAEALEERCLGCHEERENGLDTWDSLLANGYHGKNGEEHYRGGWAWENFDEGNLWWNHRAHAVDYALSCRSCHHAVLKDEEGFVTPRQAELRSWPPEAARIQRCRNCHGDDGPVADSPAADGKDVPSLGKAYQTICIECHVRLGGATQTWEGFFEKETVDRKPDTEGAGR